jgi:alcohol dehydrogenase class IV
VVGVWSKKFKVRIGEVDLYFGPGVLVENISRALEGVGKAMIVTSRSAAKVSGALRDVVGALEKSSIEYRVYDKVTPNPSTSIVDELIEELEVFNPSALIAIGGGSVIDTAKLASILYGSGLKTIDYILGAKPGFPRGNLLNISKYFFASGFPGSVRVFTASLPGLSGLHITQKPLIHIEDNNSSSKTHHPQENTRREINKFKPATHSYSQPITTIFRSVTGSKGLKLIAVNLTHGTGSEVDRFAVATITGTIEKRGMAVRYPDISFDDPVYTLTLSRDQTLYTTIDAFYHAYESATSNRSNLLVLSLAEESVKYITMYLRRALEKPRDLEARTMLLYSSMLAGVCIDTTSGTHLIHALEHGFSGFKPELPHGAGLAILGPRIVYYTHKAVPEQSARILKHIDPSIKPISDDADKAMKAVKEFQDNHGFNKRLSDYGIAVSDLKQILDFVEKTIKERFGSNVPFPVDRGLLEEVAREAL